MNLCTLVLPAVLATAVVSAEVPGQSAREAMRAGNYAEAYCSWRSLAEAGDADAQYNVGWMYHNGYGLAIDDVRARGWWEKAADQGNTDARIALGMLYSEGGRGVAKNMPVAITYFIEAALDGEEEAQLMLKSLLTRGNKSMRSIAPQLLSQHPDLLGDKLIISVPRANVRSGAGTQFRIVMGLESGEQLVQLASKGRWFQIAVVSTGRTGWVYDTLVTTADDSGIDATTSANPGETSAP